MNTTHNPEFPHHLGSLTKWAGRAALTGALGLAVIGMGAGAANADPLPESPVRMASSLRGRPPPRPSRTGRREQ
jgi:hypothetical protein